MKETMAITLSLFFSIIINGQNLKLYKKHTFHHNVDTLQYRMLSPTKIDVSKKYPLVLFMHGSGERGNDNEAQLTHGANLFLKEKNTKDFNSFVVFPQCSSDDYWANIDYSYEEDGLSFSFKENPKPQKSLSLVIKLMDSLVKHPNIDTNRIYVAGLSMGGMATFELLLHRPNMFAAAIPICGGGNTKSVKKYAEKVPVWIFHGNNDTVVNAKYSKEIHEAIQNAHGNSKLTLYEDTGHDSWTNTFAEPDLLPWLFSNKKKD